MIILEPRAGLCNRLRAIDSTVNLAKDTNNTVEVRWRMDEECYCKLSDLFDIPESIIHLEESEWSKPRQIIEKIKMAIHLLGYGNYFESKGVRAINTQNTKLWNKLLKAPTTYIRTCHDYYNNSTPLDLFTPKPHVQAQIDQYTNKHAIGIHFRGTDNVKALSISPVEAFISLMEEEIKKDSACNFFLATDEPGVEALLRETFPERIHSHKKRSLDRNNPIAIEDAVVDLYALGNCKKIIGSHVSSFSEFAAAIHDIELQKASID